MTEQLPTILVPGLLCSPRLYAPQLPALWSFGPVTVADNRRDADMEAIARRILDQAPRRFALVGLSMGGYVAATITRLAPDRVDRLALLSTGARADTPEAGERRKKQIALAREGRFAETPDLLMPLFLHASRQNDAELRQIVRAMAEETGPEAFERQQNAIMSRPDARPFLPGFRCPTVVLVGDGDTLTPPELSREIAGLIPGSRLVTVPDCGHLSTLEKPEAVTKVLVDWMKA
jgi:pimeloyl-ACP methyl ester carboxylesterase